MKEINVIVLLNNYYSATMNSLCNEFIKRDSSIKLWRQIRTKNLQPQNGAWRDDTLVINSNMIDVYENISIGITKDESYYGVMPETEECKIALVVADVKLYYKLLEDLHGFHEVCGSSQIKYNLLPIYTFTNHSTIKPLDHMDELYEFEEEVFGTIEWTDDELLGCKNYNDIDDIISLVKSYNNGELDFSTAIVYGLNELITTIKISTEILYEDYFSIQNKISEINRIISNRPNKKNSYDPIDDILSTDRKTSAMSEAISLLPESYINDPELNNLDTNSLIFNDENPEINIFIEGVKDEGAYIGDNELIYHAKQIDEDHPIEIALDTEEAEYKWRPYIEVYNSQSFDEWSRMNACLLDTYEDQVIFEIKFQQYLSSNGANPNGLIFNSSLSLDGNNGKINSFSVNTPDGLLYIVEFNHRLKIMIKCGVTPTF
jgi:hypothetical protein